jgi:hypothetical protein
MFLSNPVKIFHAICVVSIVFSGCSLWRGNENTQVSLASGTKSEVPFATSEPDVFQTQIVIRSGGTDRRMFLARDHDKRRIDYDIDTDNHRAVIFSDKQYLLFFKRKAYREQPLSAAAPAEYESLTSSMLTRRDYSQFDEVDREGPVIQFRARINESAVSEVTIFFDESIGIPIREEFYSILGDQRTLQYSVELKDFGTTVDPELFRVPADFRRGPNRP